jgi:hypothetical protein
MRLKLQSTIKQKKVVSENDSTESQSDTQKSDTESTDTNNLKKDNKFKTLMYRANGLTKQLEKYNKKPLNDSQKEEIKPKLLDILKLISEILTR